MARPYGEEKVDLWVALALVASCGEGLGSGALVARLVGLFACRERTGKDAVAVLRRAGYLERLTDPSDARRRSYRVSERGRIVLGHPSGWLVLRFARKLFTGCPSRRGARWQQTLTDSGSRDSQLQQLEQRLLLGRPQSRAGSDSGAGSRATQMAGAVDG
jgi:hypothetical protein